MGELMSRIRIEAIRLIEEVAGNSMEKNAVKDLEYIRGVTDLLGATEGLMIEAAAEESRREER